MEHRSGLIVKTTVTPADGYGQRDAGLVMIESVPGRHRITVAGDKGYDTRDFVAGLRAMRVTPHPAHYTAAGVPSMRARRGSPATPSVNRSGSSWNRTLAG